MPVQICNHIECTACEACVQSCAQHAILMHQDEYGFKYPVINQEQCVNCGLCIKKCPNNNTISEDKTLKAFVGYANDNNEQATSTSGGFASLFCRYILNLNGVVYGCTGKDASHVRHVRIDSTERLNDLKGSKYVQSDLSGIYPQVRIDLKDNRQVIFIGTPCQVVGLKSFLGKDYDNLLTVDFVCHGVPSQKILDDERKLHKISNANNLEVAFRKKNKHGSAVFALMFRGDQGIHELYSKEWEDNTYLLGFLNGLFYRPSCYQCRYANLNRQSDLTVGDYWNKSNRSMLDAERRQWGMSMVTLNTEKGEKFIGQLDGLIVLESIDIFDLQKVSGQLEHPMQKHPLQEKFLQLYLTIGYKKASNAVLKATRKSILKGKIKNFVTSTPLLRALYKLLK